MVELEWWTQRSWSLIEPLKYLLPNRSKKLYLWNPLIIMRVWYATMEDKIETSRL